MPVCVCIKGIIFKRKKGTQCGELLCKILLPLIIYCIEARMMFLKCKSDLISSWSKFSEDPSPHPGLRINSFPASHKLLPKWPWFTCGDFLTIVCFFLNYGPVEFCLSSIYTLLSEFLCPFFQKLSLKPLHPNFFLLIFNGLLRDHFLCCVCMNNQISHAWTDS